MHPIRYLLTAVAALAAALPFIGDARASEGSPHSSGTPTGPDLHGAPVRAAVPAAGLLTEVDILVLYTSAARDGAGGADRIRAAILDGFDEANLIHSDSLTQVRLNPVSVLETGYRETGTLSTDLPAIVEQTATLRRDYRADLVMLVYETEERMISGGAGPGTPGQSGNANAAYVAVQRTRPLGLGEGIANRTGRLLGCGSDRPDDGSPGSLGAFGFSRGHRFVVEGIEVGTIMASSAGMRIPYFSNPEVLYRGEPTGVPEGEAGEADNAATIRRIAPLVAEYQQCSNRVQFEHAATRVREDAGTVRLRLLRTGPPETPARLRAVVRDGTALAGRDYFATHSIVEFAGGETEKSLDIRLVNDGLAQGPRTFRVRLDQAAPGTGVGMNGEVVITIDDDDTPFRFAHAEGTVVEGGSGTTVRVVRSSGLESAASVQLATVSPESEGALRVVTATGAVPFPVLLNFSPGQAEVSVELTAVDDLEARPDKSHGLVLVGVGEAENPWTGMRLWVRDDDRAGRLLGILPTQVAAGQLARPAMGFPDGGFLACRRSAPGGAIALLRFHADGSLDPQWSPVRFHESPDPDAGLRFGRISQIARQADGRILVAGFFPWVNGHRGNNLVRLHPDGRVDEGFRTGEGFAGPVDGICVQPDGRIVAVGEFTRVDGVRRYAAARLLADGELDDSFVPEFGSSLGVRLACVAMQGENLLVGGQFERVGTREVTSLVRLHPDGTLDESFVGGITGAVGGIRVLPGGAFYAFGPFKTPVRWAARFHSNGVIDSKHRFRGLNAPVLDLLPLGDGESLVGGQFGGTTNDRPLFMRCRADGTPEDRFGPRFAVPGSVSAVVAGPSGDVTLLGSMAAPGESDLWNLLRLGPLSWSTELEAPRADAAGVALEALTIPGLTHRLERSSDTDRWEVVDTLVPSTPSAWFRDRSPAAVSLYRLRVGNPPSSVR